jgi:hypothetical protein
VKLDDIKRLDVAFLSNGRVLEEWIMLPNYKGELVSTLETRYQAIVENDSSITEWYDRAEHEETMQRVYNVDLIWNIYEFSDGKITYFVRERWKAFDLARYYVTLEYPNSPPVWL